MQWIAHQCLFNEMAEHPASFQVWQVDAIIYLRKGEVGDLKNHLQAG